MRIPVAQLCLSNLLVSVFLTTAYANEVVQVELGRHKLSVPTNMVLPDYRDDLAAGKRLQRRTLLLGYVLPGRVPVSTIDRSLLEAATPERFARLQAEGKRIIGITLTSPVNSRSTPNAFGKLFDNTQTSMTEASEIEYRAIDLYRPYGLQGVSLTPKRGSGDDVWSRSVFRSLESDRTFISCSDSMRLASKTCYITAFLDNDLRVEIGFLEAHLQEWKTIAATALDSVTEWRRP